MTEQKQTKQEMETVTIKSNIGNITLTGPKGFDPKIETTTTEYCNCENKCPICGKKKKILDPFGKTWFDPSNPLLGNNFRIGL